MEDWALESLEKGSWFYYQNGDGDMGRIEKQQSWAKETLSRLFLVSIPNEATIMS